jgi:hypothetical protein
MAYVSDLTTPEERGKHMAYYAAFMSTGSCMGYFVGGIIGDFSIRAGFLFQAFVVISAAILFNLIIEDVTPPSAGQKLALHEINPFRAFIDSRKLMNKNLIVFFCAIFFIGFASLGFDNAVNYTSGGIRLPTTYNGIIKATWESTASSATLPSCSGWQPYNLRNPCSYTVWPPRCLWWWYPTNLFGCLLRGGVIVMILNALNMPIQQSLATYNATERMRVLFPDV